LNWTIGNRDTAENVDSGEDEVADEATTEGGCFSFIRRFFIAGVSCGGIDVWSLGWYVTGCPVWSPLCAGVADVAGFCGVTTDSPVGSDGQAFARDSHSQSCKRSSCCRAKSNHSSSMMLADRRGALGK